MAFSSAAIQQQSLALARAVCSVSNKNEYAQSEFVLGTTRIWSRNALEESIREAISATGSCKVIDLAERLGIPPTALKSDSKQDILIADGKIFFRTRLDEQVRALAASQMTECGFVDLDEIARSLELSQTSLVEQALVNGIPFITRQAFEQQQERDRLMSQLLAAGTDTVSIPAELRSWVGEICKQHPQLRQGQLIQMGSVYEPGPLRLKKQQDAVDKLEKTHQIGVEDIRCLPPELTKTLIKLTPDVYCSKAFVEPLSALIETELHGESASVTIDECISLFETETIGEAALAFVLSTNNELVVIQSEGDKQLIFARKTVEDVKRGRRHPEDITNNAQAVLLLRTLMSEFAVVKEPNPIDDKQRLASMSKSELQQEFTDKLWPLLEMYVNAAAKLKRTSLSSMLGRTLLEDDSSPCRLIILTLTRLLRMDLQLSPSEDIPEEHQTVLTNLTNVKNDVEQFRVTLQRLATSSFGLSCVALDKKKEKEMSSRFKDLCWERLTRHSSVLDIGALLGLILLQVYKVMIFIPSSFLFQQEMWNLAMDSMIEAPAELKRYVDEESSSEDNAAQLESLIAKCVKRKG